MVPIIRALVDRECLPALDHGRDEGGDLDAAGVDGPGADAVDARGGDDEGWDGVGGAGLEDGGVDGAVGAGEGEGG